MPLAKDVKLEELARITHGFVGADLLSVTKEAAMRALRRYMPDIDLDKDIPEEILTKMKITGDDFRSI